MFFVIRYLCSERALKDQTDSCLYEKGDTGKDLKEKKKKASSSQESIKSDFQNVKQEL